jgi:DNA-binding GntR family transcriptional regulator
MSNAAQATPRAAAIRGEIEQMILTGAVQPGDRLNELELTARFGGGRGPVREALRSLEGAGLVEIVPNRGALVRRIGMADVMDLYDLRAGFARSAGRLAAARASAAQLRELGRLHEAMEKAAGTRDEAAYYRLNLRFHELLTESAGNPRLNELDRRVRNELQMALRQAVFGPRQLGISNTEHRRILEALRAQDAERTAAAFEKHVLNGRQRMLENLRNWGAASAA